jgi:peptide/nickel transport system permease protein
MATALLMIFLALFGEAVAPYGGEHIFPGRELQPPSLDHWFGTDQNGMDIFSRAIVAPRFDVSIGLAGTAIAVVIGVVLGLTAGYVGGIAVLLIRTTDMFQAFPVLILAMAVVAFLGQSIVNIILVVGFINAPLYARIAYTQALRLRKREFMQSAIVSGLSPAKILWRHVLPNSLGPVVVQLSITVGWTILLTAGLSFVGAGVRPPTPEWGSMIAIGANNMVTGQWWPVVFPGLFLALAIYSFAAVGDYASRRLTVAA